MKKKRVVSRGRIKVDARRAVTKLREHLLLDPDAWPLEVVRVAALCGATGISVQHDADDLRIAFDGVAPASDRVARLLDFALESSRDPALRALRLLAIALNATISTRPRRVTVAVRDDEAGDARFVFDPTLHERAGGENGKRPTEDSDHALERAPITREALGGASVVVEMNKGFSWGTFVRFASQRPLREVLLLQEATRRSAIPVTFSPELPALPSRPPVMVVSLEKHGVPGGVLEVRADVGAGPRLVFLEHGVVLSDVALPSSVDIPVEGHGVHLPIDVHVDAESWPTNASRSQVQAREVTRVVEAIHAVLPAVGRALAAIAQGDAADLEGLARSPSRSEAARAAQAFACCATQVGRQGPLAPMLDLPLARDAVGRAMSVRRLVELGRRATESAGAERVFVHRASAPLPEPFAPFAVDVPWLDGSLADHILAGVHTRDFADVHRDVAVGITRREAWMRQPSGTPTVPSSPTELLRVAIAHEAGVLAGLRGEVVVHVGRREAPNARIFVEGRMLANVALDPTLPFEAAIEWPGRLRPTLSFDSVVDGEPLRAALAEVACAGAATLSARAGVLGAPDATPATRALGRAALAADPSARKGPLAAARLWPTAAGGWVSLIDIEGTPSTAGTQTTRVELDVEVDVSDFERKRRATPRPRHARRRPASMATRPTNPSPAPQIAIAFVQRTPVHGQSGAPGGRVVLVLDAIDTRRLEAALDRAIVLVPFGPAMGRVDDGEHRPVADALQKLLLDALAAQGVEAALVVSFEDGPVRGLCATAVRGRLIQTFAGIALRDAPTPGEIPAIVVLEDTRAVPTPRWDGLLSAPPPPALDALTALAHAVRRSVVADASQPPRCVVPLEHAGLRTADRSHLRTWTIAALGGAAGIDRARSELERTLREIPCVRVLDEQGMPVSETPIEVRRAHPSSTVPYLDARPDFPTGGWRPLLVRSRDEVTALARALGYELEDGSPELVRRRELYELERARQRLMTLPRQPFARPVPGAVPTSPTGASKEQRRGALRTLVALRADATGHSAPCTLRYGGRYVAELTLGRVPRQIAVLVDTTNGKHIEKWAGISNEGRESAIAAANEAAKALVSSLITDAVGLAFESTHLGSPVGCELVTNMLRTTPALVADLQVSRVTVESAFGDRVPLSIAWGDGPTPIARRSFAPEAASRIAQVPILLEPRHAGLERLLQAAGLALQDVTRALAQVTGDHAQPARLTGTPEHPALRTRLDALGLPDVDGELELVGAPEAGSERVVESGIEILVLGDSVRTAAPDLPFGVRAIARSKRLDTRPKAIREIAARIAQAAVRHLESLAPSLEALPPFVGAAIRAWTRRELEADAKPTRPLAEAHAFVDVTGRPWSLKVMLAHKLRFTTEGPPYPATAGAPANEPAVFRLDPAFAAALRKAGGQGVADVTRELRLDAEAEARAAAPPVPPRLADEVRQLCFAIVEIDGGTVRGEVGLLFPSRIELARIAVHARGRPVCDLDAPSGWPVIAVVDDEGLKTTRRGDGLAPTSQAEAIAQRVMRHRAELLASRAGALAHPLASVEVTRSFEAFDVTGNVWIDADDPTQAGTVTVYWSGLAEATGDRLEATTLVAEARDGVARWPKVLPVSGTLFVSPTARRARLDGSVRGLLGTVVADSLVPLLREPALTHSPRIGRWKWAAALWGAAVATDPLRDTSGAERSTADVLRELRRRGLVWTSRHAGVADGELPEDAPTFILVDDGTVPLIELLSDHAPELMRELGSVSTGAAEPTTGRRGKRRPRATAEPRASLSDASNAATSSGLFDRPALQPAIAPTAEAPGQASAPERASSWLSRVGSLVSELTGAKPLPALDLAHPLVVAVAAAADRLAHPMPRLVVAASGRPITYVTQNNVLRVHLAHPTVDALIERGEVELLTAAAIGELNRALEAVTDAEEARNVVALLDQRAARRPG